MSQISSGNHASRCPLDLLCAWVSVPKGFAWRLSVGSGEWTVLRRVAEKDTWEYLLQGPFNMERNNSRCPSLIFYVSFIPHFKKMCFFYWSRVIWHVLVSGVQQGDSMFYIFFFFQTIFPYRLLWNTEGSLCYAVGPSLWSILYAVVCIFKSQMPKLSLPITFPLWYL